MEVLGARRVGDRGASLEAMFSVMCLSRSLRVADRCRPLNLAGLEGVPSWACSGVSAAWSCAVSMGEDWGVDAGALGGIEDVREGIRLGR